MAGSDANSMKKLTRTQLAYLAGLIDGEGYVGITKCRKKPTRFNPEPLHLNVTLSISITDGELMLRLCEETGLGFTRRIKRQRLTWKDTTMWRLSSKACRQLLPALLPYLRLKKQQAILVLQYLKLAAHKSPAWNGRNGDKDKRYKEHQKYRNQVIGIYEELKRLNRRGKV